MAELSGLDVSTKQVERISEKIGRGRVRRSRDQAVADFRALPLMRQCESPVPNPPDASIVATVMADGGRLQIFDRCQRDPGPVQAQSDQAGDGQTDSDDEPKHGGYWREDKIGLVMTMTSTVSAETPVRRSPRISSIPCGFSG